MAKWWVFCSSMLPKFLLTPVTSLQHPHSHHSLKYRATLSYQDHCNSFPSSLPTDAIGLLSPILYIMSSFPFTECTFDHVIHQPEPFQKFRIAVVNVKTQRPLIWPHTPFRATPPCHSPAPSRFSGCMNFLLIPPADVIITNYLAGLRICHSNVDEMPWELSSCLYQSAYSKMGFFIHCFV